MTDHDDEFCPWCGWRVYLHSSPGDCDSAEQKADLIKRFWGLSS
jgi:hypothetical protein